MPTHLTEPERRALDALIRRPTALVPASSLADEADFAGVAERRLAVRWVAYGVAYWTLTPLGAEAMGVEIDEPTEGVPSWVGLDADGIARQAPPIHLHGPAGGRSLARRHLVREPRPDRERAAPAIDPAVEAQIRECAELIRRFQLELGRDPILALDLLRRADSVVAGVSDGVRAELKQRYMWDDSENRPRIVMGRLVPRDGRMGPGKAG